MPSSLGRFEFWKEKPEPYDRGDGTMLGERGSRAYCTARRWRWFK